jgi:hypothetical protein
MKTNIEQVLELYVPLAEKSLPGKGAAAGEIIHKYWDEQAEREGAGRGMAGQHVTINPHTVMSVLRNLATRKPEMNAELKALKTN